MLYTTSIFLQLFSILSQFQRFRIFYPYYSFYAFHSFDLLIAVTGNSQKQSESIGNVAERRSSVQSLSELECLTQKVVVQT